MPTFGDVIEKEHRVERRDTVSGIVILVIFNNRPLRWADSSAQ